MKPFPPHIMDVLCNYRHSVTGKEQADVDAAILWIEVASQETIPDGYALTKIKPDVAMTRVAATWLRNLDVMSPSDRTNAINDAYRAMVKASPPPNLKATS